ncbi:MAG: SBBP repeat-containing protein [Planctomycetes bacterium]|nr:SBBP repeat-containing protein [Planctomycetota bacterium]
MSQRLGRRSVACTSGLPCILAACLLSTHPVRGGQPPDWIAFVGSPRLDIPYAIAVDPSGSVYVTGESDGGEPPPGAPPDICDDDDVCLDWLTAKISADGAELWRARHRGPGNSHDDAQAIGVDGEGNVLVAGRTSAPDSPDTFTVVKYAPDGAEVWVRSLVPPGGCDPCYPAVAAISVDAPGEVTWTGTSERFEPAPVPRYVGSFVTARYAADGALLWSSVETPARLPGMPPLPGIQSVSGDGTVHVAGVAHDAVSGVSSIITAAYAPDGAPLWSRRWPQPTALGGPAALGVDGSGAVVVAGSIQISSTDYDFITLKYGRGGEELWSRRYDGPGAPEASWDGATAIAVSPQGAAYVIGTSQADDGRRELALVKYSASAAYVIGTSQADDGRRELALVKYSASGDEIWVRRSDAIGVPVGSANAVILDTDGSVLVSVTGGNLHPVFRCSPAGDLLERRAYESPSGIADVRAVHLEPTGRLYLACDARRPYGDVDYAVLRFTPAPPELRRGDSNATGSVEIGDAVFTLLYLFASGETPACFDAADANDDGSLDVSDPVATLIYLFLGGPPMPEPGPDGCGIDPTPDGLGCLAVECR